MAWAEAKRMLEKTNNVGFWAFCQWCKTFGPVTPWKTCAPCDDNARNQSPDQPAEPAILRWPIETWREHFLLWFREAMR